MEQTSSLINILASKLPGSVTRPMYLEYNNRKREIERIWANPENHYKMLQDYKSTVESLLAISLFYRYVLGHIQGATSFYKLVNNVSGRDTEYAISVGRNLLDKTQQGHLLAAVITFDDILKKYQLLPAFFEFSETLQFLKNCKELFNITEYDEEDNTI